MNIEKIAVNKYHVWVNKDAEIKEGDWYYWKATNTIQKSLKDSLGRLPKKGDGSIKIIAASSELNLDIPTYVEWLAEEYAEKWEEIYPELNPEIIAPVDVSKIDFIAGYQTAEKELFTEDDVRKAIEMARETILTDLRFEDREPKYTTEEIIEQLKNKKL